jgi:uncharacterized protein (TIGR04442 family)
MMEGCVTTGLKYGFPGDNEFLEPYTEQKISVAELSMTSFDTARQALASSFILPTTEQAELPAGVILKVLEAKKDSIEKGDQGFERLMLDVGRYCDERLDSGNGTGLGAHRNFLKLVALLQNVDETSKRINKLVFFAKGIPDIETLTGIKGTWDELATLKSGLFQEFFITGLLTSDILGRMGRKRLASLVEGLEEISSGHGTLADIQKRMALVEREEQIIVTLVTTIQDVIGNKYGWVAGNSERDTIKRIVTIELRHRRFLKGEIPDKLFDVGLRLAKSSLLYINTLLPIIVANRDANLREEFIRDSGLDRLLIEELEEHWCKREDVPGEKLAFIRGQ